MKRYQEDFIKKIKGIRQKEKLSFRELGNQFNIPNSTIRNWCYILPINKREVLAVRNEKIRKELKDSENLVIPKKFSQKQAKFLTAVLYGCEGAKYPSSSNASFVNSDPGLVLSFLTLLRKSFDLDEKKFSIYLQIHTTHDYKKIKKFWANFLDLPENCFMKPTIREPRGKKHRNNYMGTCTLRYRDYRIQLKLLGIFEKFIKKLANNK